MSATIYTFQCNNNQCNLYQNTVEVHSDELVGKQLPFYEYREDLKKWCEMRKYVAEQSICTCGHKMDTIKEVPTDEILNPILHNMTHIPYEARNNKKFWTRYKTKNGGVPEFNPVTNVMGTGQKNPNGIGVL